MEQFNILFDGIAEPVQAHIVGPPIFVGEAIEKALVVRSPDQGRQCAWNDIGQYRARLKIAHPRLEALGTVVVHGEGEIPPVRADRNRAQAEIFLPLCKGGFIENDLGVPEIGRASCRERVCQYVSISVVAGSLKKKTNKQK